jgi:hypothetical protein
VVTWAIVDPWTAVGKVKNLEELIKLRCAKMRR